MSEWKKVKIGDFLTERTGRYKPDDKIISQYQRLDKIDFSGNIHISDKPSKTDMILVQPGDLVISGINVAKGAVAVYQGAEPVCATIHYSSYIFDDKKIDLDYFKYFVKSPAFLDVLKQQVKGGIKTEIKPKHLLPLEILIPDLATQKELVKNLSHQLKKSEDLQQEIEQQKSYTKQLRQNILQDAIEGRLTEEWRKNNPVVKGNPDFDAEALFERIQEEKSHTDSELLRNSKKKEKVLPEITDDEKPFVIPEGWKWVRLGEVSNILGGYAFNSFDLKSSGDNYVLRLGNIRNNQIRFEAKPAFISNKIAENLDIYKAKLNDIFLTMTGTRGKQDYLYSVLVSKEHLEKYQMFVNQRVCIIRSIFYPGYVYKTLHSDVLKKPIFESATGSANQANVGIKAINDWVIPFPPLAEQTEIVRVVESQLAKVDQLEKQITEREEMTKQLMQSIMKDAFREE